MIRGVTVRFKKHGSSIVPVMKNREDGRVVWQVRIFFLVVLWDELWVWSEVCIKYDCEEVLVEKLTVLC